MKIQFTVYGTPVGKGAGRAIINRYSHKCAIMTPDKTRQFMTYVKLIASQNRPKQILDCPLQIDATFYFTRPKSKKNEIKFPYPTVKYDIDNLCKLLLDCMTGIIYHDDKLVVNANLKKRYGDPPRIEVTITDELRKDA